MRLNGNLVLQNKQGSEDVSALLPRRFGMNEAQPLLIVNTAVVRAKSMQGQDFYFLLQSEFGDIYEVCSCSCCLFVCLFIDWWSQIYKCLSSGYFGCFWWGGPWNQHRILWYSACVLVPVHLEARLSVCSFRIRKSLIVPNAADPRSTFSPWWVHHFIANIAFFSLKFNFVTSV